MFIINENLEKGTQRVGNLPLSQVRILPDPECPWVVLIPEREGITETHQLSEGDQQQLIHEITLISSLLEREFSVDKINLGALGNVVPQYHVHLIGRLTSDRAWPGPIWGVDPVDPPDEALMEQLRQNLETLCIDTSKTTPATT